MDAKPGSSSQRPAPERDESPPERYGPLILRRLVKDDGRALIVYERAVEPADPPPPRESS